MKKLMIILAIAAAALCSTSCLDFRDELDELHSEIDALKTEMSRINESVDALSTIVKALQSNVYVKSVTPLQEGGRQVGYIITFSDSSQATLRNGEDGADGKDGVDGHTPVIGVRKDTDGTYYWTVDGKWLLDNGNKLPVTGQDGAPGAPGTPGQPGAPGADGHDGITPQIKTADGYWFISYDEGKTWVRLDKCTGVDGKDGQPGVPGADGKDGDSFFKSVDVSNPSFVVITLVDGTAIKLPTWNAFEALQKQVSDININVAGLQGIIAQIQNDGYVTRYEVITEGGTVVGYVLYFADGTKATVRNGKDGADGHTPVIGVKAGSDGILYWTVDGEWLLSDGKKVPVTGKDGADGKPGTPGAPGQPGSPGDDGKDGVTPQVGIDSDGYWTVSLDGGKTWEQILDAAGKPMPSCGADGQDGDSFFKSVDLSDPDSITFTLADGRKFKLPYYNSLAVTFSPSSVVLNGTEPATVTYKIMNGGEDPVIYPMQIPSGEYEWSMTRPAPDGSGAHTGSITISCPNGDADPSEAIILFSGATSSIAKRLPVSVKYVEVTSISLNETSFEASGASKTLQLTCTVSPANASDKTVTWASSNPKVATVDENGFVSVKQPGEAIITATARGVKEPGSVTASCAVRYTAPEGCYVKVAEEIEDWTGTYILVDEINKVAFEDVDLSATSSDGQASSKSIVIGDDGIILLSDNPGIAECQLTISKEGSYYSVTTTKKYKVGSPSSGKLKYGEEYVNKIVFVEGTGARIFNENADCWIRYNNEIDAFKYYRPASKVGDGVLYRKIESSGSR